MNVYLSEYDSVILFGGGVLAERLYSQYAIIRDSLAAVIDMLPDERRVIKSFHGIDIVNPDSIENDIISNSAIVFAIGNIKVCYCVKDFIQKYNVPANNVFVVNPYSSLRFFMVNDELAREQRIPFLDERFSHVGKLFNDDLSMKIWNALLSSKPFESNEDSYELVRYSDIEEIYFYDEDYWKSYPFQGSYGDEATILDCGAYIGDSIIDICKAVPQKNKYYVAFEPLKESLNQIINNSLFTEYCKEIIPLDYGVGEFDEEKLFGVENSATFDGARFIPEECAEDCSETLKLKIKAIDNLDLDVKGTLYVKMDVEGSELAALKGAVKTIKNHHPFLAICLYHRKNDIVDIPLFINGLGLKYKYFLRGGYHTILWAIPE